ncbi:ABC transporter substrate-binding protein [Meiothermus granaticius]|uniref:sn-glycerol-3-phosphate-binding periplasmic protein UgpB n=1 Tax=Meiothermus granaticius NBRC 107808 TaxID=1227551 RepID=A0A399FAU0_9DEIN|nr:ABC transporter substrate-binding protein [Meiothermus granaticius]RIH93250.1 sn-glycerol-3-phosphate-binding periplasmic protein UgpB [Meiothermus granaticius NBRC 107808]
MRRALFAILALMGLALAQKPVEITFWHTAGPPGQEALESILDDFNASQKEYKINYKYVGDYREGGLKLLAALRSGGAPNVFHAEISFLGRMVQDGIALPLDDYLGTLPNDFYPGFLQTGRLAGKTYGLPIGLSVPVFFYNADQFAARGIAVPKTWAEVAAAAQKLTTRAAKGYIASSDIYSFNAVVMAQGGSIVTKDGKPNFTDPKVVASLQYLQDLVRKGAAQSRNIAEAQFSVADFLRTKAFMGIAPITIWPLIESRAPIPFKLGVAAVPLEPGGKVPLAGGTLVALKGTNEAQLKGIVALWKFMMEPANIAKWTKATYYLPMRRSAQPLLEDFYKADPRRRVAFGQAENADVWIQDPGFTVWYSYLEDALERALKGGADAKAVLEEAQRRALSVDKK